MFRVLVIWAWGHTFIGPTFDRQEDCQWWLIRIVHASPTDNLTASCRWKAYP